MDLQRDGMAVGWMDGWMAAGQAPLCVTKAGNEAGILFGESSHPRDTQQDTAQPKERPSCHPTLDCEPGLNTLPGRAATLSQAKETDGSDVSKPWPSSFQGRGKPRSFYLPPLWSWGLSPPSQPAQPQLLPCVLAEAAALKQGSAPAPLVAWLVSLTKP